MTNRIAAAIRHSNLVKGLALLLLLAAAGCAPTKPKTPYLFYPSAPDEPRLQYLTGFSSQNQFFGTSGFKKFVLGPNLTDKAVGKPYGIGSRSNEIFYCDSTWSGVGRFKLDKEAMEQFIPTGQGKLEDPINAATDAAGNLYVTDTVRGQVMIYGPDGAPLEPMGRKDEMKPCGLAIAGTNLYLTDMQNHQVRIYGLPERKLARTIPRPDDDGKGKLFSPVNVAVDQQGRVYVSDPGAFRVQVYDAEGKYLRTLGSRGTGLGNMARPRGLAVDREGRVYVVDAATQVVQLFDDQGRVLIFIGDPSIVGPGSTSLPAGIAIDYDNVRYFEKYLAPGKKLEYLILLTNEYGDPRISVYGFLKQP
jgi:sugar lactone lactonase YvrE